MGKQRLLDLEALAAMTDAEFIAYLYWKLGTPWSTLIQIEIQRRAGRKFPMYANEQIYLIKHLEHRFTQKVIRRLDGHP